MKWFKAIVACISSLLFFFLTGSAQTSFPPDQYNTASNAQYWKNRAPFAGYWQQDVHYNISASINEQTDIIDGEESIIYTNNSPDTLNFVFFHLYQNAFQPGSYFDNLNQNNHVHPAYGKYESAGIGNQIERVNIGEEDLEKEIDNTVMKVLLNKPLLPAQQITIHIKFKTYYDEGGLRRRMKIIKSFGTKQYNGAQWFPKLAVYDRKMGWDVDQHLNHEFYGDYGTFDVSLNFPSNYVVEATGLLQNREEVLPDSLRAKLDIKNFKDKKWNSKPSIITPYKAGDRKTWRYHAENVHDFAFVASPLFRLGEAEWNGIKCIAIVQEQHASGWQNAAEYTAKIIQTFSNDFGYYVYPKMIVADAEDGMEYPMLTMDGGKSPSYNGLLIHEVGHNWFYGMIGNNETYRAMLDEGFTQFLTAWGLEHIDGMYGKDEPSKNKYVRHFTDTMDVWERNVYWGYLRDAVHEEDMPINTHSDQFNGAIGHGGGYRHVYSKTATMLRDLQYVLGDTLFSDAMKHYFNQWKICHPYPEDFRNSIIQYTHVDLNWFFDEWMETTKKIDYSVEGVKKGQLHDEYLIKFKRKGESQMPINFNVTDKKGVKHDYYIPNNWFEKKTDATKLPRWIGWGEKLKPTYTARVYIPEGIKNVKIDPSNRLADVNELNNSLHMPVKLKFDSHIYSFPDRHHYIMTLGPDLWYNAFDGVKVGVKWTGNYLNYKHVFNMSVWYNTGLGQWQRYNSNPSLRNKHDKFSVQFDYRTGLDKVMKFGSIALGYKYLDGLEKTYVTLNKSYPKFNLSTYINLQYLYRISNPYDLQYLMYPDEWKAKKYNSSLNIGATYNYTKGKSNGTLTANLRSSAILSAYDYHYANIAWKNNVKIWRLELHTRVFAQGGTGKNWARESSLYFAQANPEEMMDNKYVRSKGLVPDAWAGSFGPDINHFQYGGGLNLRGYAGYYIAENDKYGNVVKAYRGTSGWSANAELDFDRIIPWHPKKLGQWFDFDTYLFADAGMLRYQNSQLGKEWSKLRADAGVGATFTIKKFWALQGFKPITIRFDMPFYVSDAPFQEGSNTKFRWMFGINRAF